eukprot:1194890-Prorocentrum_minimum.AAC.4
MRLQAEAPDPPRHMGASVRHMGASASPTAPPTTAPTAPPTTAPTDLPLFFTEAPTAAPTPMRAEPMWGGEMKLDNNATCKMTVKWPPGNASSATCQSL